MRSDTIPISEERTSETRVVRFGWVRLGTLLAGLAALAAYLLPRLTSPGPHWPRSDVNVYWWGGHQAVRDAAIYAPAALYHFTYPPFAAVLFGIGADAPVIYMKDAITAGSVFALVALCWMVLGATGVRRRPETVFAVVAFALLALPVAKTLQLGEVDLIVATLVGVDLLPRRNDGHWWQGIATGLAAAIKLTPLIFVVYLLITRRVRAAAMAAATFAATLAAGFVLLPSQSRTFWLGGVFLNGHRAGNPANSGNQSLSGALARLSGGLGATSPWWLAMALLTGLAGIMIAAWAHQRGHRLAGVACCAITGLLVSPISWTHHWVWAVPLLVALIATAWRRRSGWYGLAALVAAAVFSDVTPTSSPGFQHSSGQVLASDIYVLCGLAVLMGTATVLAREWASAAPRHADQPGGRGHDGSRKSVGSSANSTT